MLRGTLDLWHEKLRPLSRLFDTASCLLFLKIPLKTEKMMLDVCFCCHWRPNVTLPSSGREAVKQLWIRCIRTCNSMKNGCQC